MQVLFHTCQQRALEEGFLHKGVQPCKVAIRLVNCPHAATHIRQLRSSSVGKPWLCGALPAPHRPDERRPPLCRYWSSAIPCLS